ncbi:MAG: polyketide synthase [Chloroflexota bacterium]|nr:MAG: polyketide synthase [Chloroflexota bacterium]
MREPIAIIGIGCRFPGGANSPEALWELLRAGRDAITEVPADRYDLQTFYDPRPATPGKVMSKWGGFLDGIDRFDPLFFGISPREAERMDPQQRLLLEVAWEALEDAGQVPNTPAIEQTGVFVGMWLNDFEARLFRDPAKVDFYMTTGSGRYSASGRLSYVFGFQGPSITVDTACSSSLVAVHLAVQSLRAGECDLALAGGANVILQPHITIAYSQSRMMAPDGRCKFGDARADGYVRSEGAGLVVLKRLADALADGDPIYAIIRGSATNNDGRSSGFLTTPGGAGQEEMLRKAYKDAGVPPGEVQYIEAHGTGTAAGDPVEIGAIGAVVAEGRRPEQFCTVGSVKTNLGHTEGAAGVAGLIKVALALKHRTIPASLNFQAPNPGIPWETLPVRIQTEQTPWPAEPGQAVGGVSAFGIAGTNAHVVLQEAPARDYPAVPRADVYVLPLSARTPEALVDLARAYEATAGQSDLHDLCYSASVRRAHHPYRMAAVAHSPEELVEQLEAFSKGETRRGLVVGTQDQAAERRVVFVFPGQGGQWLGMGRQLFEQEPVFREALERCAAAVRPYVEWDLLAELLRADENTSRMDEIDVVQPALFVIQVALAELWRSWGIAPDAVIGHSMGEVAAAYVSGALSLDDAARIICRRSLLMKRVSGMGAMAMVELPLEEAEAALGEYADRVGVAVTNSPRSCVLSGDPAALAEVVAALQSRDVFCRPVKVDVAAHSPHMDALRPELVRDLAGLQPVNAAVPVYSTVTGELRDGAALDADYWGANLRQPVLFAKAVRHALEDGYNTFIEISPHPVLLPAIERGLRDYGLDDETAAGIATLVSTKRDEDERLVMLESLAALYTRGGAVDWRCLYPAGGRAVRLPTYPWKRDRYWFEAQPARQTARRADGHPLLGPRWGSAVHAGTYFWEAELDAAALPYLADHRVGENIVLPAAAFGEMALAALAEVSGAGQLEALSIQQALILSEDKVRVVQVVLTAESSETFTFRCLSRPAGEANSEWTLHAAGVVRAGTPAQPEAFSPEAIETRCVESVTGAEYYRLMAARGLNYGANFQTVGQFWRDEKYQEGFARFQVAEVVRTQGQAYRIHPALLDGCLQLLVALLPPGDDTYLPVSAERVCLYAEPDVQADLWGYAYRSSEAGDYAGGDVFLLDANGGVIAGVYGLRLQRIERAAKGDSLDRLLYHIEWPEKPLLGGVLPQPDVPGSWLVLSGGGMGAELAARLEAKGERCVVVSVGDSYRQIKTGHYMIDPTDAEGFGRLLQEAFEAGKPACRGVIHLWGLESGDALAEAETHGSIGALHLVRALVEAGWETPPRLWLITRGSQAVGGAVENVGQAALWGLGAVIANEHAELRAARVDLSPEGLPEDVDALFRELWLNDGEDQIALRGSKRYVARLALGLPAREGERVETQWVTAAEQPFRAGISSPGILDNLELRAMARRQPGPGQVEIEVHATGLNFMNVMAALGALPGYPNGVGPLGIECAGVISAVGEGADAFRVGDEVIAVAFDSLATHALADEHLVAHKPGHLSFVEAASVPIVFLTAYYGLFHQARLEAGERVLIHAAAGGVGLAAVQLAQQAGAEIYATAGSPEKRAFLESLGVEHIMDSRSLAFADEIMARTGGEGVDVILNSLAGEAIPRGLAILRPYGRFVEIGKRDIYQNSQVGLMPFQKNLSYFAVDLDKMARERPAALGVILRQLVRRFETGELTPIPTQVFSMAEVVEAFRHMAQAKHIGKIVVARTDKPLPVIFARENVPVRGDGAYLITGGLGGLGLTVARWLVDQGARHLVLTGRRGASETAQEAIRELEAAGAAVQVVQADVSDGDAVAEMLRLIEMTMPPLRGVVHAAGILDDSLLAQMTREQFRRVMSPKMDGAWNLHALTEGQPLDFFVMFSSVTALLGTPGQGNYAAGNAFMDALAHYRRARGLPGLSINWGPWSGVGLAAAEAIRGERLASRGLGSLSPDEGMALFHRLMTDDAPPQVAAVSLDVGAWTQAYPASAHASLLISLQQEAAAAAQPEQADGDFRRALLNAEPGRQRRSLLENHIREQVAQVLRVAPARISLQQPLRELGIDSLLTLELRNRLESSFKLTLSATLIFNYPTVAALTGHLAEKMNIPLDAPVEKPTAPQAAAEPAAAELDALSRDEIEALLAEELKSIDDLLKGN